MNTKYEEISVDRIIDPVDPMRTDLTQESVQELVESIKSVGIIEPLIVRANGDNYEVIAGHRRLTAARFAGLMMVPCVVRLEEGLEAEILKVHENLARAEISPIDWANHLTSLKTQYKLSTTKIAEILGMSDEWVRQHLDILNYPDVVLIAIKARVLSFSAARELAQIKDPLKRTVYVKAAVRGGVTPAMAAQWRKEANQMSNPQQTTEENPTTESADISAELQLPICPVCKEEILAEQQHTLIIHTTCRPE